MFNAYHCGQNLKSLYLETTIFFGNGLSSSSFLFPPNQKVCVLDLSGGQCPPFFLKRGAMAPFLRSSIPFWKKGGRKGGKYTKKGGIDTDRNTENPANLIPANTDTEKTAGNTAVYNSSVYLLFLLECPHPQPVRRHRQIAASGRDPFAPPKKNHNQRT